MENVQVEEFNTTRLGRFMMVTEDIYLRLLVERQTTWKGYLLME